MKTTGRGSWWITLPLAGITAAYGYFFYLPRLKEFDAQQKALAAARQELTQAQQVTSRLERVQKQLDSAGQYLTRWNARLPSADEAHLASADITDLVRTAGAEVGRFTPESPEALEAVQQQRLRLSFQGTFEQAWKVVQGLEKQDRFLWVEKLQIEAPAQAGQHLQCSTDLVVFARSSDKSD